MIRIPRSTWLVKLFRHRGFVLIFLLLVVSAALAAPWFWASYHFRQAKRELQRYHPGECRRHLAIYLQWRPHDVTAHLLAARANRQLGNYDEAEQHLVQAQREQGKTSLDVTLEWALHRATLGDLKQTELYLQSMAQTGEEEAILAYEALAEGYRRNYRIPRALAVFDKWLRRRPNDIRALLLRGRLWVQAKRAGNAVPDYRRVLELEPECEEAQRGLAFCLTETAHWNEAVGYWQALARRHPADADIRVNLARCWGSLGKAQQAKQALLAVLQEHPDHVLALSSLGGLLLQEQQPEEAEKWLRRAVQASPQDYQSRWFLYRALQRQDKTTEADSQLDQADQLEHRWQRLSKITEQELLDRPHDAALQAELGVLLIQLGFEEAGRNWLLSALQEDPNCAAARAALENTKASDSASRIGP
jgi:tetratricopeptide (TPR) repeat protein